MYPVCIGGNNLDIKKKKTAHGRLTRASAKVGPTYTFTLTAHAQLSVNVPYCLREFDRYYLLRSTPTHILSSPFTPTIIHILPSHLFSYNVNSHMQVRTYRVLESSKLSNRCKKASHLHSSPLIRSYSYSAA